MTTRKEAFNEGFKLGISEQANSFECVKCGSIWTEEAGASQGFTCDDCYEEVNEQ